MQQGNARQRAGKGPKVEMDGPAASGDMSDIKDDTTRIMVTGVAEVQSDFNPQEPLQKCVRFSPDMNLLLAGGTDGHVRVWEVSLLYITFKCITRPAVFLLIINQIYFEIRTML